MRIITGLVGLASLATYATSSYAVVADQFKCTITLFDYAGETGPSANATLVGVRNPEATSSMWTPGVSATYTSTSVTVEDKATQVSATAEIDYTSYTSINKNRGAQDTCFRWSYTIGNSASGVACMEPDISSNPYDPTDYYSLTTLDQHGVPLFRAQDLPDQKVTLPVNSTKWHGFTTHCDFLGTVE